MHFSSRPPFRAIRNTAFSFGCVLSGVFLFSSISAFSAEQLANIDSNLQHIVDGKSTFSTSSSASALNGQPEVYRLGTPGRFDESGRVLTHVNLDGTQPIDSVEKSLTSLNANVVAKNSGYRSGVIAAYLPKEQIPTIAKLSGVRALTTEHAPHHRVGSVTSQGSIVLRANLANKAGYKGQGITIGVISDSFDTAKLNTSAPPATTAADDVASGDLPVVNVLQDYTNNGLGATDEGRAMCQIVYDIAPKSSLAFATADVSEVGFANNILALRTQANADVIVDDVGYFDEPVFSDGIVATAVNTVATSKTLPGKPVVYASSAGNDGDNGYRSEYRALSDKSVRANPGALKLVSDPNSTVYLDPSLTAGGWHNWNPGPGPVEPYTSVTVPADAFFPYFIFFQWDDPFDQTNGITANYNFLVFDQDGNYIPLVSSTTDTFGTQQPMQAVGFLNPGQTYYIAITKTTKKNKSDAGPKTHQFAFYTTLDGAGKLAGKYFHSSPLDVPNIYGHPAAANAIACAAYVYDWTDKKPFQPQIEDYTSPGPVIVYFDQYGNRLKYPEIRLKPEVAGVDGVATTFFGQAYDGSTYSFFGTSAAAPHVAGVAALVIQAAGGPKSIDPSSVKTVLESTTPQRDIDPLFAGGLAGSRSGFVAFSVQGEAYDGSNFYTINYYGPPGQSIQSLTLDGTPAGLIFNTHSVAYPPEIGTTVGISPSAASFIMNAGNGQPKLTVNFKPGTFTSGAAFSFRVKPDLKLTGVGGSSADSFAGVKFTVGFGGLFADSTTGTIQNQNGAGFSQADGFGLIDAENAVQLAPFFTTPSAGAVTIRPGRPGAGEGVIPIRFGRD
jgi:hypothetical protein